MSRAFHPAALVALPTLTARAALSLLASVLTTARTTDITPLPPSITDALHRLDAARANIERALGQGLTPHQLAARRTAHLGETQAWAALLDWLSGFARLPPTYPEPAQAARMIAALFPDGLKFTRLPYRDQWAEVQTRLLRMRADQLDQVVAQLGGASFLHHLDAAHTAFGAVLGITGEARAHTAPQPTVREALDEARTALRSYALRVAAWSDEGHGAVADRLLGPLARWTPSTSA